MPAYCDADSDDVVAFVPIFIPLLFIINPDDVDNATNMGFDILPMSSGSVNVSEPVVPKNKPIPLPIHLTNMKR